MKSWTTWRFIALAALILAMAGLGIYTARATLPAASGCLTTPTPVPQAAEAVAPAVTPTPVASISTEAVLLARGDAFPRLLRTLTLHIPTDAEKLAELLRTSPATLAPLPSPDDPWQNAFRSAGLINSPTTILGRNSYRKDLIALLSAADPGAFRSGTAAGDLLNEVRELPRVVVDGAMAQVTVPLPGNRFFYSYPRGEGSQEFVAEPWQLSADGRDLTLSLGGLRDGAIGEVNFCVEGMQILATSPDPTTNDGAGRLTWTLGPDPAVHEPIAVTLRPEVATAVRLWLFTGEGRFLALAWTYLSPAILLLASVALIPRQTIASSPLGRARTRLCAAALAVLLLALVGVLTLFILLRRSPERAVDSIVDIAVLAVIVVTAAVLSGLQTLLWPGKEGRLADRLALGLVLIGATAWIYGFAAQTGLGQERFWEAFPRTLLAAGYGGFLAVAVSVWRRRLGHAPGTVARLGLLANIAVGIVLCTPPWLAVVEEPIPGRGLALLIPLWVTANVVAGFVLLVMSLIPDSALQRLSVVARWVVGTAVTAVIIVLTLLQWAWAIYLGQNIWLRAPLEARPGEHLAEFVGALEQTFLNYPIAFLGPICAALPLLGLAGLIGVLSVAGEGERLPFWPRRSWVSWTLVFLFAVFVVGYGGDVFGFRLPLALLLALPLLMFALSDRLTAAAAGIDGHALNAHWTLPRPLIVSRRRELLTRATALAGIARQRDEAYATYEADPAAYHLRVGELDAEATCLERGLKVAADGAEEPCRQPGPDSYLVLPAGMGPRELAVAAGPTDHWWERGTTAVRLGLRLAWLPIAYFLFVIFSDQARGVFANPVPFAVPILVTALANEVTFWLVAAFTFGCLYPSLRGSNGVIKGAVLGGVYAAAHFVASVLGATGDTLWQVRSVQLLLYLAILGILVDAATVESEGLSWRYLIGRYNVQEAKTSLSYAASLIATLIVIGKQFLTGEAADAISTIAAGQTVWTDLWTAVQPFLPLT